MRIPLALQSYRARDLQVSAQRIINFFPEAQPADAKARVVLLPTPGLRDFVTLGGPIRGMREMGGFLFVVSGTTVYRVSSAGVGTAIGLIADGGPVTMDHNGEQLAICTPETGQGWVATTSTVTQITDTDFLGVSSVASIDGYMVWSRTNSTQFIISALNDATSYNALDFASAEGSPDNLVAVRRVGRELWLFGETSIEIWNNVGAADFPFLRISGAFIERGCAARDSIATRLGVPFWLGEDRVVYRGEGFTAPMRISTHAIEQQIGGYATVSDARGWVYEQEGHVFYVLTFPSAGETWVFDLTTGLWHERESEGYATWRGITGANVFGAVIAGDVASGGLFVVDPTATTDNNAQIIRTATGTCIHSEGHPVTFTRLQAEFRTGVGLATGQGSDPQVFLSWSDDGGNTWSDEVWRTLGATGRYGTEVEWRRLGRGRERVFRMQVADPVRVALLAVNVEAEAGE